MSLDHLLHLFLSPPSPMSCLVPSISCILSCLLYLLYLVHLVWCPPSSTSCVVSSICYILSGFPISYFLTSVVCPTSCLVSYILHIVWCPLPPTSSLVSSTSYILSGVLHLLHLVSCHIFYILSGDLHLLYPLNLVWCTLSPTSCLMSSGSRSPQLGDVDSTVGETNRRQCRSFHRLPEGVWSQTH